MDWRVVLIGLMLTTTTLAGTGAPVSIQVNPSVSIAPATLGIRVRVPPEAENRTLEIVLDSDDFYRSSRVELDGDRGPTVTTFRVGSVPAGDYEITAAVTTADGQRRGRARVFVEVMAGSAGVRERR